MAYRKRSRGSYGYRKKVRQALKQMDKIKIQRKAYQLLNPRGSDASKLRFGTDFKSASADQRVARSLYRYRGLGDYGKDFVESLSNMTSIKLGGNQYGLFNFGHGSSQSANTQVKGLGDYGAVTTNSLMGGQGTISVNAGPRTSTGDISFSHTEFIQNVVVTSPAAIGNTPFQVQSFNLNPGLPSTFPFLAQIACNYSMWEIQGLVFQYKPTSGEFGSSGSNSLGKVIMATQYDSTAAPFASSQEMENYIGSSSCKPSCGMMHGVETAPRERLTNLMYVRQGASGTGPAPAGQKDRNLTDLGLFQIATEGIYNSTAVVTNQVIGELWVSYRIVLTRPKLCLSILGASIPQDYFLFQTPATPGVTVPKDTNTLGGTLAGNSNIIFYTFPTNIVAGTYRVVVHTLGTTGTLAVSNLSVNCTWTFPGAALFGTSIANGVGFTSGAMSVVNTTSPIILMTDVQVNAPGTLRAVIGINLGGATLGANPTNRFFITQVHTAPDQSLLL